MARSVPNTVGLLGSPLTNQGSVGPVRMAGLASRRVYRYRKRRRILCLTSSDQRMIESNLIPLALA